MRDGQVILFRHHGEFLLGRHVEGPRGKLQVGLEPGRVVRINPQQVVLEADAIVTEEAFPAWRQRYQEILEIMNLAELWELVQDEDSQLSLTELADLYWGVSPDALQRTALQTHLAMEPLYFVVQNALFVPRPRDEVEAILHQRQQEQETARDEASFVAWLSGKEETPPYWTPRQREWLEELKEFAVQGDTSPTAKMARRLLRGLQPTSSDWRRIAFNTLVQRGVFQEDEPLELYRRGVPLEFPPQVLQEGEQISLQELLADPQRRDLTDLELITIDEESTRDMDDALSLHGTSEGYLLGIHIADASALVPAGGALDVEAARRMSTIYLPERTVSMLPPRLAEEMGGLYPDVPRLTLSLLIKLTPELEVGEWEVVPSIVRSRARLSYEEADQALASDAPGTSEMVRSLWSVASRLREERLAQGALEMNRPELKVEVDAKGSINVQVTETPTRARRLVAEFMVLANRLLAELCQKREVPAIYRAQTTVEIEDLRGVSSQALWNYLVMRRLHPTQLDLEPRPHALLGVSAYLQATSPLRRYLDLVMQRQILHFLAVGEPAYDRENLAQLLYQIEGQMRELPRLEEQRKRYWLLKYLRPQEGEMFQGVVLEARHREALVELLDYPLRVNLYPVEYVEPGETVTMLLQEADLWRLTARVTHIGAAN